MTTTNQTEAKCANHCGHDQRWFVKGTCTHFTVGTGKFQPTCGHHCFVPTATDSPAPSDDDLHRWEIEPHPDPSFDTLITNSDRDALAHILSVAELYLWDGNEPGQERVMQVRMNDVPTTDAAPATPATQCLDCNHPQGDPNFHFDATEENWGAALHWFRAHPPSQTTETENAVQAERQRLRQAVEAMRIPNIGTANIANDSFNQALQKIIELLEEK